MYTYIFIFTLTSFNYRTLALTLPSLAMMAAVGVVSAVIGKAFHCLLSGAESFLCCCQLLTDLLNRYISKAKSETEQPKQML